MEIFNSNTLIDKYLDRERKELYLNEARKANQFFNLFSRNIDDNALQILLAESLLPLEIGWLDNVDGPILDIGSGWGIPAIPLLMACPELEFVLLERSIKKADWLTYILSLLHLKADVTNADLFELKKPGHYQLIITRQVALNDRTLKKIKSVSRETATLIGYGSIPESNLLKDAQTVDFQINQAPAKKIFTSRLFS